LISWDWGCKI